MWSHSFTLRQLQYIVSVYKCLNFRQAAEECAVSQPSLSAQVAQVEAFLGVTLFERTRRSVRVTRQGEDFVVQARKILELADELEAQQRQSDPFKSELHIGLIPTMAPYVLPDLGPLFHAHYPEMKFFWHEYKTLELLRQLEHNTIDVAILAWVDELESFEIFDLWRDKFYVAVSKDHELARGVDEGRTISAHELMELKEGMYLLEEGHCFRDQALEFCARSSIEEGSYRATSLATLVQVVASGRGVTLLPQMALDLENRAGQLQILSLEEPAPSRRVVMALRKVSAYEEVARALCDVLARDYVKE